MTLYEILGIAPSASTEQVKAAYRRAAMRWHPDRNTRNVAQAEARFKELAHAYAVLSDASQRADYDARMHEDASSHASAHGTKEDAEIIFLKAMFELASTLAANGYNRDVLLGALLSQGCPEGVAAKIAEQVAQRHTAQHAAAAPEHMRKPVKPAPFLQKPAQLSPKVFGAAAVILVLIGVFSIFHDGNVGSGSETTLNEAIQSQPFAAPSLPAVPSTTLTGILQQQQVSFNEQTGAGHMVYTSLPSAEEFDRHRDYLGMPYEIKLIQKVKVEERQLLFFASKPVASGDDDFSCHFCAPILSAMLLEQNPKTGLLTVLKLQPLEPAGGWGEINLDGSSLPFVLQVGPAKTGFILTDSYLGQGYFIQWGSLFSIEPEAFKSLTSFHVGTSSAGTGDCIDRVQTDCPQKDTQIRFNKSAVHSGYFDIAVKQRTVEVVSGITVRTDTKHTLRYNGSEYLCLTKLAGATSKPCQKSDKFTDR